MTTQRLNTSLIRFLFSVFMIVASPVLFAHNSVAAAEGSTSPQQTGAVTVVQPLNSPTSTLVPLFPPSNGEATLPNSEPAANKGNAALSFNVVTNLPQNNQTTLAVNPNDFSTSANPFRLSGSYLSADGKLRFSYPGDWISRDVQGQALLVSHQVAYTILDQKAADQGTFLVLVNGQDMYKPSETGILAEKDLANVVFDLQLGQMDVSKTTFITINGHMASMAVGTDRHGLAMVDVFAVPAKGTYLASVLVICNPNNLDTAKALAVALLQTAVVS